MIIIEHKGLTISFNGMKYLEVFPAATDVNGHISGPLPWSDVYGFLMKEEFLPKYFQISKLINYDKNNNENFLYDINLDYYTLHFTDKAVAELYFNFLVKFKDDEEKGKNFRDLHPELEV